MKNIAKHIFILLAFLLCTLEAFPQGKVYTRKAKLEDFPISTTKVVIDGNSFLGIALREEIALRWRISPYEHCTPQEYDQLKTNHSYYFINLIEEEGIAFLVLTKGGKEEDSDQFKRPFEVVRVPFASVGDPSGRELIFMGAFVDILQIFVEDAMLADQVAYSGLKHYNSTKLSHKVIYLDPEKADEQYLNNTPGTLVGICISPTEISKRSYCYKMLITADSHELYYYKKFKYRGSKDAAFTDSEIKQFINRDGIIAQ
ncbi:MAG: hypothetical protein IIU68_03565 [Bacteroidales bacterium]|nr:hypothetical protein [Bacteroidales bacterium]